MLLCCLLQVTTICLFGLKQSFLVMGLAIPLPVLTFYAITLISSTLNNTFRSATRPHTLFSPHSHLLPPPQPRGSPSSALHATSSRVHYQGSLLPGHRVAPAPLSVSGRLSSLTGPGASRVPSSRVPYAVPPPPGSPPPLGSLQQCLFLQGPLLQSLLLQGPPLPSFWSPLGSRSVLGGVCGVLCCHRSWQWM